jgi:hypothetical protein
MFVINKTKKFLGNFKIFWHTLQFSHENMDSIDLSLSLFIARDVIEDLDLICGICLNVLTEPATILSDDFGSCCQHSFCGNCLSNWRLHSSRCPNCRAEIKSVISDLRIKRYLTNQFVKCPLNETEGCDAFGKLGSGKENWITEHLSKSCPFQIVQCECGEKLKRKMLDEHKVECPVHGKKDCPFKFFGCQEKLNKLAMERHLASADREHLLLSLAYAEKLSVSGKSPEDGAAGGENPTEEIKLMQSQLKSSLGQVKSAPNFIILEEKNFSPSPERHKRVIPEWTNDLKQGSLVDVLDEFDGQWYECTVQEIMKADKISVKYNQW